MSKKLLPLLLSYLFCFILNAQTDSVNLKEMVLVATKTEKETFNLPNDIVKIDSKHFLQRQARTSPEILLSEGIWTQKTNHGGGSLFIRGLTGNQILLLIDGIRLNNSTYRYGPNQYLNTVDVFSIGSVEILRGGGSVLYGSDALGGTLQMRSKEIDFSETKKISASCLGRLASQNMEKSTHANFQLSKKKWAIGADLTYRNFGDLVGGDTTGIQTPSGYNELAYSLKVKLALAKNLNLTALNQLVRQEDVAVFHKVKLENFSFNQMQPQQRHLSYLRFDYTPKSKIINRLEANISLQNTSETRQSQKNGTSKQTNETDKIQVVGMYLFTETVLNPFYSINTGTEVYVDKVNSEKIEINQLDNSKVTKRGLYPDGASYSNFALYQNHHLTWKNWAFQAGLRYNLYQISMKDKDLGNVEIQPSALVYDAAIQYFIQKKQHFYTHFSTGFRAPNIDDMGTLGIVDFRYELPNYNLAPEKSRNFEIGYKINTNRLKLNTYFYYNHLQNLITRTKQNQVINTYQVYIKENTDQAFIRGFETNTKFQITSNLGLNSAINYTFGQNLTKNEPLRRIPPLFYNIQLQYSYKKFYTNLTFFAANQQTRLAQGDKDDNRIPKGGTGAFQVLHWFGGYTWRSLDANISVQNITNADYRIHGSGVNGAGRHLIVSLRYTFKNDK